MNFSVYYDNPFTTKYVTRSSTHPTDPYSGSLRDHITQKDVNNVLTTLLQKNISSKGTFKH